KMSNYLVFQYLQEALVVALVSYFLLTITEKVFLDGKGLYLFFKFIYVINFTLSALLSWCFFYNSIEDIVIASVLSTSIIMLIYRNKSVSKPEMTEEGTEELIEKLK
ncbi:hypothetical protein LJB95_02940, partial [Paludibacteraceae bacterium OttesenSCG-928-F17]|nr:hypothetical protein [Paludibacteraceae bacterium OttesenSCG-928-F17]